MPIINNNNKNLYRSNKHKSGEKYFPRVYDQYLSGLSYQIANTHDRFGSVVAISGDGNTIAVGGPHYTDDFNHKGGYIESKLTGMVKIYSFDGNNWNVKGSHLYGDKDNYMMGISIDINYNGTRIVIGSAALEYGPASYLDYSSSVEDQEHNNGEIYTKATRIYDQLKASLEIKDLVGDLIENTDASIKSASVSVGTHIANTYLNEIKASREKKIEPDVLLSIHPNTYFEDFDFSPEGDGYPDINIRYRGNVKVYGWENNDWKVISSIDGKENFIPENFGACVAISDVGSTIAIGIPRYSCVERYREINPNETWYIVASITGIVFNAALTVAGGPAGIITAAAEMGIGAAMKNIESRIKSNNKFIQKENEYRDSSSHNIQDIIEDFNSETNQYRTNHIVYKNMGAIATYYGENSLNYQSIGNNDEDNHYSFQLNSNPPASAVSLYIPQYTVSGVQNRKGSRINTSDNRSTTLGSLIGNSYLGTSIAMTSSGGKIVTFDKQDNSIRTKYSERKAYGSVGSVYYKITDFNKVTYISNEYDTTKVILSISGDGNKLAVGLPYHYAGLVLIYTWHSTYKDWIRNDSNYHPANGGDLLRGGDGEGDEVGGSIKYGNSLSLSYDGTILAVGSPFSIGLTSNDSYAGRVKVYKWNFQTESWFLHGSVIYGSKDNLLGTSLKLSSDGNTLVIGAPCKHHKSDYITKVPCTHRDYTRIYTIRDPSDDNKEFTNKKAKEEYIFRVNDTTPLTSAQYINDMLMPYYDTDNDETNLVKSTVIIHDTSEMPYVTTKSHTFTRTTWTGGKYYKKQVDEAEGFKIINNITHEAKVTITSIYKTRMAIIKYDKGEEGFVKVFKFIKGDWNQNCIDSNESTDINTTVIPDAPFSSVEMRGRTILNLYVDTDYIDAGINTPNGFTLAEPPLSNINTKVFGYYNISYFIKNRRGHISRFDRDVNVIRRPTLSKEEIIILKGDIFNENANHGLFMEGQVDEVISFTHNVNTAVSGLYYIEYGISITKNPYNSEVINLKRPIRVIPKRIISLIGGTQFLRQFNLYKELGATIMDTDNNIIPPYYISRDNAPIRTDSGVLLTGIYYVTYSAKYAISVKRKIIVYSPYFKSLQSVLYEISQEGKN